MLAGVNDSDEVLGNDYHSGFSEEGLKLLNMSCWVFGCVFGSPIVALGN